MTKTKLTTMMILALGTGLAAATPKKKTGAAIAPTDLTWTEVPNTGGVKVAPLWGDMMKTAHGILVTFPAGSVHPLHTHSANIKMVVISGTFTYSLEGAADKSYGPGSFIEIPGGTRHTSGCAAGAPCVAFHEATARFDLKEVKTAHAHK